MTKKTSLLILVADNDVDNRQMLRCLMEIWDFQVIEAKNGVEASRIAEELCPDLILMDVRMPLLDGFDVARLIRRSKNASAVPILFLSGCGENFTGTKRLPPARMNYSSNRLILGGLKKRSINIYPV